MPRRRARHVSPLEFYGLAGPLMVVAIAFLLYKRYDVSLFASWLITANVVTILFFGYDKLLAWSERQRIPEKVLLGLSLIGGSPGGLASMLLFRHKVRKASFQRVFWTIVILQAIGICIWYFAVS